MRILLDTHIWPWALMASAAIPLPLRERLRSKRATFLISAASAWEIAIKAGLGRLRLPTAPQAVLRAAARDLPVAELPTWRTPRGSRNCRCTTAIPSTAC